MKHRLSFVLTLISLLPTLVLAQGLMGSWHEWLNIPSEWATPPNLIYYVFIPFLGTFAIIWGILTATHAKIFQNNRVNIVISFVFAISLFYFNILPPIILYLFTFGGIFGVVAFFILFFVLTFLFGKRKIGVSYRETKKVYEDIEKAHSKEMSDVLKKSKNLENVSEQISKIEEKKREILIELGQRKLEMNRAENMLKWISVHDDKDIRNANIGRNKKVAEQIAKKRYREASEHVKTLEKQWKKLFEEGEKLRQKEVRFRRLFM